MLPPGRMQLLSDAGELMEDGSLLPAYGVCDGFTVSLYIMPHEQPQDAAAVAAGEAEAAAYHRQALAIQQAMAAKAVAAAVPSPGANKDLGTPQSFVMHCLCYSRLVDAKERCGGAVTTGHTASPPCRPAAPPPLPWLPPLPPLPPLSPPPSSSAGDGSYAAADL
jgi:xanthine/CO dehydrogenase XdhC/CoxF family maturation factor